MTAIQEPLLPDGGKAQTYQPDKNKWVDCGAADTSPADMPDATPPEDDLQHRLNRLAASGAFPPILQLKLRLDLLTQFVLADPVVGSFESAYAELLARAVTELEQQSKLATPASGLVVPS
jgi:hypothetical protein